MENSDLCAQFLKVVYTLPRAKRRELRAELTNLAQHFDLTEDLTKDRRGQTWQPGGAGQNTIRARKTHHISWRRGESLEVSLTEAAVLCNTTNQNISSQIAKAGFYTRADADGDVVTVTRLSS